MVSFFHSLAAFSRYLVCDADDSPRRRSRSRSRRPHRTTAGGIGGDLSYSALALPNLGQGLATVLAHGLVGMSLGLYAWNVVAARAGEGGVFFTKIKVKSGMIQQHIHMLYTCKGWG